MEKQRINYHNAPILLLPSILPLSSSAFFPVSTRQRRSALPPLRRQRPRLPSGRAPWRSAASSRPHSDERASTAMPRSATTTSRLPRACSLSLSAWAKGLLCTVGPYMRDEAEISYCFQLYPNSCLYERRRKTTSPIKLFWK